MRWVVLGSAFVILWFLALQVILPIGIRSTHETGDDSVAGTDPGAPSRSALKLKIVIATAAALALWMVFYGFVLAGVVKL